MRYQSSTPFTFKITYIASKTILVPVFTHMPVQIRFARTLITADHTIELLRIYLGCVSSVLSLYMRVQSRQSITVEFTKHTNVLRSL